MKKKKAPNPMKRWYSKGGVTVVAHVEDDVFETFIGIECESVGELGCFSFDEAVALANKMRLAMTYIKRSLYDPPHV